MFGDFKTFLSWISRPNPKFELYRTQGCILFGNSHPPGGGFLKETYDWGGKIKGREVTRRKIGKGNQTWSQGGGKESKARELYTPLTKLSGNLPGSILRWFK